MKNKEIEELLNDMSKVYEAHVKIIDKYNNADEIHYASPISLKQINLLLSYIEQLQKIPKKALDFVHENSYKKGEGTVMYDVDIHELENILRGGSDE